jgi:DNA processing protein
MLAFTAFGSVAVASKPQGRPPLVLWAVGPARLDETAQRAAAVVGTRAATSYGEQVAGDLAAGLAEQDVAVISGGAYGIDGAVHRAVLAVEGVTVGVLAGGLDIPYPAGHSGLLHRVASTGLLITEYPPAPDSTVTSQTHIVDTGSKPHDITHYLTKPTAGRIITETLVGL